LSNYNLSDVEADHYFKLNPKGPGLVTQYEGVTFHRKKNFMETSKTPPPEPATAPFRLPAGDALFKLSYAVLESIRQNYPEDYKRVIESYIPNDEKAKSLANFYGKLLCLERRQFDAAIVEGQISSGYEFRAWFESKHGKKFPARAYSSAKVFDTFVLAPENHPRYVQEVVYDMLTSRLINATSRLVNAAKRHNFDLEHDVFVEAAAILKAHGDTAAEQMEGLERRLDWDSKNIGGHETKVAVFLTKAEAAARRAKAAASDTHGQIYTMLKSGRLDAILAVLLNEAQQTSDSETARKLAQFAAVVQEKLRENVVEDGTWVKSEDGRKETLAKVPRFPPRQLEEWRDEVREKDITEMSDEDKRTEYWAAVDRMTEIAKSTKAETLQQWASKKGSPVDSASSTHSVTPLHLLKTAEGIVAVEHSRLAELQVLKWLLNGGWDVKDVSEQNMGYDLGGRDSKGQDAFVEVKSINYPGAPFSLTSNEYAVAAEKGPSYFVALVPPQTGKHFEVVFITDPVKLKHSHKCLKWVWEFAKSPLE
jgi:hypothetical protein